MKKLWHHYLKWEDYKAGMYRTVNGQDKKDLLKIAIEFTGNADQYGKAMLKVIHLWPISCEQNLTSTGSNRQAWIGHAAACLELGLPEDITREAWGYLSEQQQDEANKKADEAISLWEGYHEAKNFKVC